MSAAGSKPTTGLGQDAHSGAWGREGHLKFVGGRHPAAAQNAGPLGRGAGLWPANLEGTAEIAWDEPTAREAFLVEVVADADRLLVVARDAQDTCAADSPDPDRIVAAN